PYVVSRNDSHSFRVRHLVISNGEDVHASHLTSYADSNFEVTDKLLKYVAAQSITLKVARLTD
ncbi:hypothetical protein PHYSODRAFT_414941, partial [Phytophthora sojae]